MRIALVIAIACLMCSMAARAADPRAGQQKSAACQACHGPDGNSTSPQFPRLAGQYPDYLVEALTQYKNGERKNPIMAPFAAQLSPRDMEDLAAYFSSRPNGLFKRP